MTSTTATCRAGRTRGGATAEEAKARKRVSEKLSPVLKNGSLAALTAAANVAAARVLDGKSNSTAATTEIARPSGVETSLTRVSFTKPAGNDLGLMGVFPVC